MDTFLEGAYTPPLSSLVSMSRTVYFIFIYRIFATRTMLNIYSEEYIFSFKILQNFLEKKTKIAFKKIT